VIIKPNNTVHMKQFLITYRFSEGSETDWHQEVKRFIEALDNDPELQGRITYRCMKSTKGPEYYHLAIPVDEEAVKLLGEKDYFKHYTEQTEIVSGGSVHVTPLEVVAETN
jgi:hypothetical protein